VRRILAMRRTIFWEIVREHMPVFARFALQFGRALIHHDVQLRSTSSGSRAYFPVVLDIENSHIHKLASAYRDIHV
jgi:hypothetical protein